jgi:uncharacterized protein (TIGR03032 family)
MQTNPTALDALADWLGQQSVSLAFTTYRANRLMFVGRSDSGRLALHERLFDRPMGLHLHEEGGVQSLWMASRCQLWRLDNLLDSGQTHEGADRLFVPAASFTTGDVNAHEIATMPDGAPLFVNTAFSCLATVQPGRSFAPIWQPPFISKLTADDRCHLNGMALIDGQPTWATACGTVDAPAGWRGERAGGGVLLHIPSNSIAVTGLAMPHSPRWHQGKLWLLNSGTGELGWVDGSRFVPLCFLPGFARGLAFVGNTAIVGLSKLRSPQFTGLPLEQRLQGAGLPGGCCGLRVIDLATGAVLHSLDLPEPMDELFDVVVLPGVRQPKALGLQGEDIHCLVKLAGQAQLVTVRPKAPSGNPHQAEAPALFGLPQPATAADVARLEQREQPTAAVRYQQVYQLTPQTLAPYVSLTFPSLAPGSARLAALTGELLAVSAMASGTMVGLVIAERTPDGQAKLVSMLVEPGFRRLGIAAHLVVYLQRFVAQQGVQTLSASYQASAAITASFEPLLAKLGWPAPQTDFVLIQSNADKLATTGWATRYALKPAYSIFPWLEATPADMAVAQTLGAPAVLLPPQPPTPTPPSTQDAQPLEPAISLGLRHQGALVGWLIAHRVAPDAVRYSSVFVAPAHRLRGQGLALLAEGFNRQHSAGITHAKAAIAVGNAEFLRMFRRHLQTYLTATGAARSATSGLLVASQPRTPHASAKAQAN